jgi:hypothetical protein
MGRFETRWLAAPGKLSALADLSGRWIESVRGRRPTQEIELDMDSSVSPTHGEQEMSPGTDTTPACYHPLFVLNQLGDMERCTLRPGHGHSADGWERELKPIIANPAWECSVHHAHDCTQRAGSRGVAAHDWSSAGV